MNTKTLFLALACLTGSFLFSQEKKAEAKKAPAAQSSSAACYQDKKWKLYKVEKFGQEKDPADDQKNDFLQLKADNTFTLKYKGIDKFGTYTKGGVLQLKMADGSATWPFKVISCDGSLFKADYKDEDVHNILTYKAE